MYFTGGIRFEIDYATVFGMIGKTERSEKTNTLKKNN